MIQHDFKGGNAEALKLIDYFGSVSECARRLGLRQPSVTKWKKTGIPVLRKSWIKEKFPDIDFLD